MSTTWERLPNRTNFGMSVRRSPFGPMAYVSVEALKAIGSPKRGIRLFDDDSLFGLMPWDGREEGSVRADSFSLKGIEEELGIEIKPGWYRASLRDGVLAFDLSKPSEVVE